MGAHWTDEQLLALGYWPSKFRGFSERTTRQKHEFSLSTTQKDEETLTRVQLVRDKTQDNFLRLILSNTDGVMAFLKESMT